MTNSRRAGLVAFIFLAALGSRGSVLFADVSTSVRLMVGRSAIVNTDAAIARISLTSSDVADAMVTLPNQLLIQGKVPGTISMFVWDRAGAMRTYEVTVERDLSRLTQQMRELFPAESIKIEGNGRSVIVAGTVASKYIAEKAIEVAAGYVEKKEDVVSLMQVRDAGPPPQVLLRVRFAEVSRSALTELGASLFTGPNGYKEFMGRTGTQQFPAPFFDSENGENKLVFSDFLNLFVFDLKNQLGAVIKALQTRGLFQSLAEPNLVAESGKEASFLAGGEFPIPVAQGGAAGLAISVVFKEFGIRLNFTPTVAGTDRVRLKVRPEVSTLDFTNAIVLEGFRIPALSTRRTETEIELRDGQTFAIAGLLNNTATQSLQKVPGIGDIPILGLLFRSKAAQKQQTELVVMITPHILNMNSSGVTPDLPRLIEPYMPPLGPNRTFPSPPPAFAPAPKPSADVTPTPTSPPAVMPTPAETTAMLAARLPKAPTLISSAELVATAHPPAPVAPPARAEPPVPEKTPAGNTTEQERKAKQQEMRATKELEKRQAKEAELERRRQQQDQKRQQELAREQAKRDAQSAEKAARDAERQAEIDKKHQKAIDDAAARLKTAEAAYQVELARKNKS